MIEMLGVLAIIGVLSVGGIMGYSKAMMRYRINKTIEQITYIAGNIRTTFASQGNYDGVDNYAVLKKAHIVPEDMLTLDSSGNIIDITHSFGGRLSVYSISDCKNGDENNEKAFYLAFYDIPIEACIELAVYDWEPLKVGGFYMGADSEFFFKNISKLNIEQATNACSGVCPENNPDCYVEFDLVIDGISNESGC